MNVYIATDIEGVAGVVFYEHRHVNMSMLNHELLHRNRVLLTEEVNAAARKAIDDAGPGGRFILSTGDQCGRDTPDENIRAMVDTARTYGGY